MFLLIKVDCRQGKALGTEEGKMMRNGRSNVQETKEFEQIDWSLNLITGWLCHDNILTALERMSLDYTFEVNVEGASREP